MATRWISGLLVGLSALTVAASAGAQSDGLTLRGDAEPWPKLQARVSVATHQPLLASLFTLGASPGLQGGRILGDYYFSAGASHSGGYSGGFRATSGLLLSSGGISLSQPAVPGGGTLSVTQLSLARPAEPGHELAQGAAYLGVGYTGLSPKGGWGFTADVGLMASGGTGLRLRSPGVEESLKDLRLTPVLQLGVSYSF